MIVAGIDAGSRTIKVVLLDAGAREAGRGRPRQGIEQDALAQELLDRLLAESGLRRGDVGAAWPQATAGSWSTLPTKPSPRSLVRRGACGIACRRPPR